MNLRHVSAPSLTITPKQAAGLTFKFVLFQVGLSALVGLVQALVSAVAGKSASPSVGVDPNVLIVVNTLTAFLVVRGQWKKSRLSWPAFLLPSARWVRLLPCFFLIMIGEIILCSEAGNVMERILPPPQWLRTTFSSIVDLVRHPWSGPFVLIVVAAVTEECLFRGIILRGLLAKTRPARACVITSLLFAAMHLNPWQMPSAFLIGMVFGGVYLRTRSLTLCILGHGLHNAMVFLAYGLPFTVDGFNRTHDSSIVLFQPWWFNAAGLVSLSLGAYLFHRNAPVFIWTPPVQVSLPPPLPLERVS